MTNDITPDGDQPRATGGEAIDRMEATNKFALYPWQQAEVLNLYRLGFSAHKIAERIGIPLPAVWRILVRNDR